MTHSGYIRFSRTDRRHSIASPAMTTSNLTFIVQIVGIDPEGEGPHFYSEAEANEYAAQATANGFQAVITSY